MKEIRNTTPRPLRVPLPQGKTLHLGPRNKGQVTPQALEHPPFQKLVEDGHVEVLGEGEPQGQHPIKEPEPIPSMEGELRGPAEPGGKPLPTNSSASDEG